MVIDAQASAASKLAATWRAVTRVREMREARRSAIHLQSAARRRAAVTKLGAQKSACLRLQSAVRGTSARARARTLRAERERRTAAATALQCCTRQNAARRHAAALRALAHLAAMAKLHQAARFVQAYVRFRSAMRRRRQAARLLAGLAKTITAVLRLARFKKAMLSLQARARARRCRERIYKRFPELADIAVRARKAYEAGVANPELWLHNRTNAALSTLLLSKNLGDVLRAVSSLEMFTLISPYVCERMVKEGAVPVLFTLLATCNRSTPHQKIVAHGLRTLTSIAKLSHLREAVCRQPKALSTLVELVQGYRDKTHHGLLWDALAVLRELVLRGPPEWREQLRTKADFFKRLESVHALLTRSTAKENEASKTQRGGSTTKPSTTALKSAGTAAARGAPATRGVPAAKGAATAKGVTALAAKGPTKGTVDLTSQCMGALKALIAAGAKKD